MRTLRLAYLLSVLGMASLAVGSGLPPNRVELTLRPRPIEDVNPVPASDEFPSRVTPREVRALDGSLVVGDPSMLMDRDTGSASTLSGSASLVFELERAEKIASLRLFGRPDLTLSLFYADEVGWQPVPGLTSVRTDRLDAGWNELVPASSLTTSALRLDLVPSGPGAVVPEIEIWRAGEAPLQPASSSRLCLLGDDPLPASMRAFDAPLDETTIEDEAGTVSVAIPRDPSQFRRAYLVYELRGLSSWMAIPRAINGRPAAGGIFDTPSDAWSRQIERINPEWLRRGDNRITFEPSLGSLPYTVRSVRLLVELDTATNGVELVALGGQPEIDRALHAAVDGDPSTPWTADAPATLTLALDRRMEPSALGLLLGAMPAGTLEVRAIAENGATSVLGAWSADHLRAGWNVLPLDPGSASARLQVVLSAGGAPWQVLELLPIGSGVGARAEPAVFLSWPTEGQFYGREAYIRGFASPRAAGEGSPRITVGTTVVDAQDGTFGVLVSKDDVGYGADDDSAPWTVNVEAVYPGGPTITRTVVLSRFGPGPESIEGRLLGPRTFSVHPGQAARLRHDGASLDLEEGSVDTAKDLKMTPLRAEDLPALDAGMTNVTRSPRRGYRFEPHGTRFTKGVRVSLPYDTALLPEGMTEEDIQTFYFDDQAGRWRPLPRVSVDAASRTVVSLTDHFTDMINGTLALPDHPQPSGNDPTVFAKAPPADPAERIVLIDPPKASNTGDARVSYPLDLPAGRADLTPDLRLEYSSASGNGWLGMGWSLGLPSVAVDTRWGVPRFEAAVETESYTLAGEQLTPGAHRGALEPRSAEKAFRFRREGRFSRIVRHGGDPASYWWEVTDKDGTVSTFGGPGAILADDQGRISRWLLREKHDPRGNGIRYAYAQVNDTGLPAGKVLGRQLYLQTIEYTTFAGGPGAFAVTFRRDAEMGEPLRHDVTIDARGGFKEVTSHLLRRVEVAFQGAPVRSWELQYRRGAFEKTLLDAVTQRGADGSVLATHRFGYHDDVRQGDGYVGFLPTETWHSGDDGVRAAAVDEIASLFGSDAGRATGLSGYETKHAGGHLYVGFNPDSPTKQGSAGGKVGFTGTVDSQGLLALVDLNGDHLPDKVFKTSAGVFVRLNQSGPQGTTDFGPALALDTLPALSEETASIFSSGAESYFGVSVLGNEATGITSARRYFADVNGDGLPDLVDGGAVLFNRPGASGVPTFDPDGAASPVPVGPAAVDTAGIAPDYGPRVEQILAAAPLHDTLRRWVAPFPGQVHVSGDVQLVAAPPGATADGVRVAIQHNGTELWSATIDAGDTAPATPTGVDAVSVQKGDRLYFRVQSRAEGSHDEVTWDPEIAYVGAPSFLDANGLSPWRAKASEDFVFAGRPGILVKLPFTGRVRLAGDLHKTGVTTDAVVLTVLRNGVQVHADVLQWDEVGDIPLGIAFDVDQDDTLQLRVKVDSPIDLAKIVWAPSLFYEGPPDAPPPSHTIDGTTIELERVNDGDGNPIIQLHPPYDIDFYPVDGLAAPQSPWVADDDATVTVSSHLTAAPGATGIVFMTAKRRGSLAAKRTILIFNGFVFNQQVDIDVLEDDEIFFDYSCYDPALAPLVGNRVIEVDGDSAPSAFHSTERQGVFPLGYRGWAVAGYNGNPPRDAAPVVESDLEVAFDASSTVDPRTAKAYLFTPFSEGGVWRGPEEETAVSAGGARSSRLGPNAVAIPGADGPAGRAPIRLSSSLQTAGQVGVALLSGSLSDGDGGSDVDFLDMNGDRFPDVVGRARIQYSPAVGGLEAASRGVSSFDAPRRTDSTAGNVGVGGSPANFRVGSRGQVDAPGRGGASKENDTRPQMVSLGLSGSLGSGASSLPYDLTDLNGDGLPDRVLKTGGILQVGFNLGYAFAPLEPWGPGALNEGQSESLSLGTNLGFNGGVYDYAGGLSLSRNSSETTAMLADINGDGLADRLVRDGDALRVGLNVGNRFLADTEWGGAPQGAFATSTDSTVGAGAYFTVGIGPVCFIGCWVILNPGVDGSTSLARQESALLDLDGDGYPEHVASTDEGTLVVARNTTGRTNLLRTIDRPLGAHIEIEYQREGNTPDLPQSRWILSRVTIHDGLVGDGVDTQAATFRYQGGRWDRLEREFYGFGTVEEEIRDVSQGGAVYRAITRTFAVDSFYTHGLLLRERLRDGAGRPFTETENTFDVRDVDTQAPLADLHSTTATGFPGLVRTDRRFFEGQPAPGKTTYSAQEFDALGNVVRIVDVGDAGPVDDLEATLEYPSCATTHIVGVPVGLTVRGNGTELRRRSGVLDCATGNLASITEYLADGTGAETVMDRDVFGNVVRLLGPPNRSGQRFELLYAHDPLVHTYVTQTSDSFGYVSTSTWDVTLGQRTRMEDVAGNATTYTYDAHGRLTSMRGPYEQGPGASPATVVYAHHPEGPVPWSLTRHLDAYRSAADPIESVRFVDGLKRVVQEKSDAAVFTGALSGASDGMTVSGRVVFDAVGRVQDRYYPTTEPKGTLAVFNPTFDPVTPTRTTFDVLDRPLTVTIPDGTGPTSTYGFGQDREGVTRLATRVLDANGVPSTQYHDVRELLTAIKDENRVLGSVQEIWTSYGYDALKRMTRITDDRGNVTRISWDNLGRKIAVDSPDEGLTEDVYDLAGNRTARTTANLRARGGQITYVHAFNRLERVVYPEFPGNGVTYAYGAPGAPGNGAARVIRIADQSGTRERIYGKLGEIVSETRTIASATGTTPEVYTTQSTYDSFNRLQRLVYPDGEVLTLRYDSGGKLRQMAGRKGPYDYDYLRRMEYDKFGEHAFVETGNGTRTTYAHRPDNRYLEHVVTTRPDGRPFVNLTYAYDAVGNVLSRSNAVPVATGSGFGGPSQQTFAYDDLDRLTASGGSYEFAPGKLDRYAVAIDYDTIHNMTSRLQHHEIVQPSGSAVPQHKTSYAFQYAYAGQHPHAATHVGERALLYDGNGNQLGWQHDQNGTRRDVVWDEENRMQRLFENGQEIRFVYDAEGERVIKRGPQGETVYVNPWLTVRNRTTGTKHVWAGSMRLASKLLKQDRPGGNPSGSTPLEKDRYFYHQDHTGTTNFVTDASGQLYEHLEYFPFGETWVQESSNTQRTPYLFTAKELDEETGLTYFGARYHDPRLGSFNSGEPLLFGSPEKGRDDPKFMSVYSYAHQNPERYLDPDGRDVIILVGTPQGTHSVGKGYPAAAATMKADLAKQKITAHIIDLGQVKGSATALLKAKAAEINGGGAKVTGVMYIGHGDIDNNDMMPRRNQPMSVKEAIDAANLADNGAFAVWGCEVQIGKGKWDIQRRGIHVRTTRGKWTYTRSTGEGALGHPNRRGQRDEDGNLMKEEETKYINVGDFVLSDVTQGVDQKKGERTILQGFKDAEDANATP